MTDPTLIQRLRAGVNQAGLTKSQLLVEAANALDALSRPFDEEAEFETAVRVYQMLYDADEEEARRSARANISYDIARAILSAIPPEDWHDQQLPEDNEIAAALPAASGDRESYQEAERLVGARRSKRALIELVAWLIHRHPAEPEPAQG